jgi:hypothetical protein
LDSDRQEAFWYSFGVRPADAWTAQFFPGRVEAVDLKTIYPMLPDNPTPPAAFLGPAPVDNLPVPELSVLEDQVSANVRTLSLRLISPRLARGLLVKVSGAQVLSASVNGIGQTDPAWAGLAAWYLRFYGMTGNGIELQLKVRPSSGITLTLTDQSDGLPDLPGVTYITRSSDMMPFAIAQEYMPYPETVSVSKIYTIP